MAQVDPNSIQQHSKIFGADGTHVGTVDQLDGERIKLSKNDSVDGQHHYLSVGLIASVDDEGVHLSANGAEVAQLFEESE